MGKPLQQGDVFYQLVKLNIYFASELISSKQT